MLRLACRADHLYVTLPSAKHTCAVIPRSPQQPPGAFVVSGGAMRPAELYPDDLVFEHEAVAATGVPGPVIRQWARRGKIQKFAGRPTEYSGKGHEYKTMYALPEVKERAETYKTCPQRRPKAARAA